MKIITLAQLQEILASNNVNTTIDWKKILEKILDIEVNNKTRIKFTDGVNKFIKKIRWLAVFDDETFFNWFYAKIFFEFRPIMQFYPIIDSWKAYIDTFERNYQRHEQCIEILEKYFPFVMPSITKKFITKDAKEQISKTFENVSELIRNFVNQSSVFDESDRTQLISNISDIASSHFLTMLLPPHEPKPELKSFVESFNENDTLTRFVTEGKIFRENKLKLKDKYGISREIKDLKIRNFDN